MLLEWHVCVRLIECLHTIACLHTSGKKTCWASQDVEGVAPWFPEHICRFQGRGRSGFGPCSSASLKTGQHIKFSQNMIQETCEVSADVSTQRDGRHLVDPRTAPVRGGSERRGWPGCCFSRGQSGSHASSTWLFRLVPLPLHYASWGGFLCTGVAPRAGQHQGGVG